MNRQRHLPDPIACVVPIGYDPDPVVCRPGSGHRSRRHLPGLREQERAHGLARQHEPSATHPHTTRESRRSLVRGLAAQQNRGTLGSGNSPDLRDPVDSIEQEFDLEAEVPKVVGYLARVLKVEPADLCLCGSGLSFAACCVEGANKQQAIYRSAFRATTRYRDSQGGAVDMIPAGLFRRFLVASAKRLPCLIPDCDERPVRCHLIPEAALRTAFGDHCLEFKPSDSLGRTAFVRTGVGRAGAERVFCARHDNDLFREIDRADFNVSSPHQHFLLALKALAFSHRKVQVLLGMDFQVEVLKPFFMMTDPRNAGLSNFEGDGSYFHEQYLRFVTGHGALADAVEPWAAGRWDYFSQSYRTLPASSKLFVATVMNPSHDLFGVRIDTGAGPVFLSCSIWPLDDSLRVAVGVPAGASRSAYASLIDQLAGVDDETFVAVLNNLLTANADSILLAEEAEVDEAALQTITDLRSLAGRALVSSAPTFHGDGRFLMEELRWGPMSFPRAGHI